ncbi:recombinase family protein [Bradyrhizobium sp.]|uniref:recombinase family protein n=1 Tax=Bradyrhizobium sp. TaxID=376 RepID=UPI00272259E9|nr:recombinase family protein [Bradyrhizobium sp.]MDO9295460.1 recombinase family protein [Bradyrhizobium sp.]
MNLPVSIASRAALYLRVSTTRQAEVDLSIPDQRSQTKAYCERQGWQVVADYIEPGASAMDDQRPEFQRMIERASDDDRPFDVIVVHSFSRFFRDAFGLEMYIRRLAKHGVRLVSITQELGDDPSQVMMRQVIALFDEYQSRENAKHVLRAMKENARQGFYNGSRVPLGYAVEDVEKRGHRTKKRLIIDPVEAETVRLIFKLYLEGDGASGPLGVKEVAKALNTRGIRTRLGARFGVGPVHLILTNPLYIGEWRFNRRHAKTGQEKPVAEVIAVEVPPIIERETFDQVRRSLKARNPRSMPPRITTGPILLTGLAYCASCSSAMTLRTGTSKTGRVYRYYSCSGAARMGKTACKGRSIPMDRLDQLVTGHIADYLLVADRIADLLAEIVKSRAMAGGEVRDRIDQLSRQASIADDKLRRLYALVEDGVTDLDEVLKIRLADIKADRDQARSALDRIKGQSPAARIDRAKIERFGSLMRQSITTGDIPFRKAYLRSFIDAIEVDDRVIRIHGSKSSLEQAVIASSQAGKNGVRSFVRKWRARRDSNS